MAEILAWSSWMQQLLAVHESQQLADHVLLQSAWDPSLRNRTELWCQPSHSLESQAMKNNDVLITDCSWYKLGDSFGVF